MTGIFMKIEYTENITKEFEDVIYKGFRRYALKNNIEVKFQKFAFVIKDEKENIFGGLAGHTIYKEIVIDELFVEESLRNKGYGFDLLSKVEKLFKGKGYDNINLITYEFQAPKFYEKYGFELDFVRKNKTNPQLNKYFFSKSFEE
jgi:GNAT superfamily N-acetyltransferase